MGACTSQLGTDPTSTPLDSIRGLGCWDGPGRVWAWGGGFCFPPASLTQQPLPVLDEDFGRGHHLFVRAVFPHRVDGYPDPRGLGMHGRDVSLGMCRLAQGGQDKPPHEVSPCQKLLPPPPDPLTWSSWMVMV